MSDFIGEVIFNHDVELHKNSSGSAIQFIYFLYSDGDKPKVAWEISAVSTA